MRALRHIWLLTVTAVCSIPERLGTSSVIVISITTVTAVLVAMLALGQGLQELSRSGVRADQAVVVSAGAQSPLQSSLPKTIVESIADKPGIKRNAEGKPEMFGAIFMYINAINHDNRRGSVSMYFVTPGFWDVNRDVRIIEGRNFQPGLREIIVSDVIRKRFRDMDVGNEVRMRDTTWKIVGAYQSSRSLQNSVIGDAATTLSAFPQSTYNSVSIIFESPAAYATFKKAVTDDPTLEANVMTQLQSSESIIKPRLKLLDFISYFLGSLMGLGAACGALASLYASVDARTHEIGTLRAIGFSTFPVVFSVLAEGILLAIPAALLGAGIVWYLFNGHVVVAQQITFPMAVTPHLALISIVWSLGIALVGGILPAIRAARLPVALALKAS